MLALALLIAAVPALAWTSDNHTCALQAPIYSCQNTSAIVDTCCSPVQGLVLVTQYWDTYTGLESQGQLLPRNHWGVHGLWPDHCDGSYGQYCDLARQYDPFPSPNTTTGTASGTPVPAWKGGDIFTGLMQKYGKYDLLAWMQYYWINQGYPNWEFWQHEFSKHATCFSTYDVGSNGGPDCYGQEYTNTTEESIVDFIESVARAQLQYPTFQWLSDAGIVPSNTTTYSLATVEYILTEQSGAVPYIGCAKDSNGNATVIDEVWYYAHSLGKPQSGVFLPVNQTGSSSCSKTLPLHYYLRSTGSDH